MKVTDNGQMLIEWGVATEALVGEDESGDKCLVAPFPNGVLVTVVDGLGHGSQAAAAARDAIVTLESRAHEPVELLIKRCHEQLRGTRGVVMSLASFNAQDNTMTWLGVGNVEGRLLRADDTQDFPPVSVIGKPSHLKDVGPVRERLVLRGGIVGYRLPKLRPVAIPVRRNDTLIFVTDGVRSGFDEVLILEDPPHRIANQIFTQYRRGTDDALVLVARYIGREAQVPGVNSV